MADTNQPQQQQGLPPTLSSQDYRSALHDALDADPSLRDELTIALKGPTTEDQLLSKAESQGRLGAGGQPITMSNLWSAVKRGAVRAGSELTETVVGAAAGISKGTGLYKLGRSPEEEAEFLKWYEKPVNEWQPEFAPFGIETGIPATIGEERVQKWMGPRATGALGFVEGISQFTVGMIGAARILRGVGAAGKVGAVSKALQGGGTVAKFTGVILPGATAGVVADLTFFDPHEKRLSNLMQDGPEWMRNPMADFLSAKEDDTEAEARFKQALEGFVLGATVDALLFGLRAMRARIKARKGEITTSQAGETIRKNMEALADVDEAAGRSGDAVGVVQQADGTFQVLTPRPKINEDLLRQQLKKGSTPLPQDQQPTFLLDSGEEIPAGRAVVEEEGSGKKLFEGEKSLRKAADDNRRALNTGEIPQSVGYEGGNAKRMTTPGGTPKPSGAPQGPATSPSARAMAGGVATPEPSLTFANRAEAENVAASINMASKNANLARGTVSPEMAGAWQKLMGVYKNVKDPREAAEILERYGFNPSYTQQPEEVLDVVKALGDLMPEPAVVARGKTRTFEEIARGADDLFKGMSGEDVVEAASKIWGNTDKLPEYITAMRTWLWVQARQVQKLSQIAETNPSNALAVDQLAASMDTLLELHAYVSGTSSSVGRALGAHKMGLGEAVENLLKTADDAAPGAKGAAEEAPEAAAEAAAKATPAPAQATPEAGHRAPGTHKATAGLTRDEVRALARSIFLTEGDPAAMLAILRGPKMTPKVAANPSLKKKWLDFILTYRMEAMLSGPKTHVTNALNNLMVALQRPVEYWWAGTRAKNPALQQMGADMMAGLAENLRESWSVAKKSFMVGENILDPGNTVAESGKGLGAWADSGWLKRIFRAPSRFLMTSDEFFKQLNYRANIRAQILRKARSEGITDPGEISKRLKEDFNFAFDPQGGAVNPSSLQYARVGTFTNELEYGWGQSLQELAQKHPSFRLVMPFIRTPVNIFRYAWERTPGLNRLNREFAADLAAGGERAAIARAKTEMGMAVWSSAALLALSGKITGKGPADPELRKQWKDAGNQPYSINLGGRWVSFRRGDPVLTAMGLVADIVQMSGEMDEHQQQNVIAATMASITANVSSKTFMQGITEFMDAVSSGRADITESFMQNMVGSFIPNVLRQSNPDDTLRETRTMLDEISARLPGFSEGLEPRRNIFGEKVMKAPGYLNQAINPFTVSAPIDQDIADELVTLGRAFTMPAEKRVGGLVDLTDRETFKERGGQSPYDRMLEIMASPGDGRASLKQAMEKLIRSPAYQKAPAEDAQGPGGLRHKMAADLLFAYQQQAFSRVLKEYPTLKEAMKQANEMQGKGLLKGAAGVQSVMGKYETLFTTEK